MLTIITQKLLNVFEDHITSNLKIELTKNTEHRKTKSLFLKRMGRKCRLKICTEQNNDHTQIKLKIRFCSSFKMNSGQAI